MGCAELSNPLITWLFPLASSSYPKAIQEPLAINHLISIKRYISLQRFPGFQELRAREGRRRGHASHKCHSSSNADSVPAMCTVLRGILRWIKPRGWALWIHSMVKGAIGAAKKGAATVHRSTERGSSGAWESKNLCGCGCGYEVDVDRRNRGCYVGTLAWMNT